MAFSFAGRIREPTSSAAHGLGHVLDDNSPVLIYVSLDVLVIAGVTIFFATKR
jgi:hypothetical protein